MDRPGLAYWHGVVIGKKVADSSALMLMTQLPRFAEASRLATARTLERQHRFPVLLRALKDTQRLIYCYAVVYLHAQGGVTLARIQQLCIEMGLASPGRAAAILVHLRALGYVRLAPEQPNRRERRYLPSPDLEAGIRAAFLDELHCLSLIEPDVTRAIARMGESEFFRAFVLMFGKGLIGTLTRGGNPATGFFAERDAGLLILYDMLLSGGDGDVYPPKGPVRMSVMGLSRRHAVSRSHVLRLFKDAEKLGLLTRDGEQHTGALSDTLRAAVVELHAAMFVGLAACCEHALRAAGNVAAETAAY